jgi:superoxide dismutase
LSKTARTVSSNSNITAKTVARDEFLSQNDRQKNATINHPEGLPGANEFTRHRTHFWRPLSKHFKMDRGSCAQLTEALLQQLIDEHGSLPPFVKRFLAAQGYSITRLL